MPKRPTASSITDDEVDILWGALRMLELLHFTRDGLCHECGHTAPCRTARVISRQRSKLKEAQCRTDSSHP